VKATFILISGTSIMPTLIHLGNPLSDPDHQRHILDSNKHKRFADSLKEHQFWPLRAESIDTLQINVGKRCNQTCRHCHVDAGPDRRESMDRKTIKACIKALDSGIFHTVDITGGAPEMNPHFKYLVSEASQRGCHIIDRCNLTILLARGYEDLPVFLKEHEVEIVASLPCYMAENTDSQRGSGVFDKSISALQNLNQLGYGNPETPLMLNLVYNPVGAQLPGDQAMLEATYRKELRSRYNIVFNHLFTITNMPIHRFLDDLLQNDQYDTYMQTLIESYSPQATQKVMCRQTLSVGWDGTLYDCDFNQMLELPIRTKESCSIHNFDAQSLINRTIRTGQHCYGCTAGSGSSCRGVLV